MDGQTQARPETWGQKQWDRSAGIRQAALAAGVGRIQKIARMNARLVRKTQDGTLGTETTEPEDEVDDTVHVGDITINMPQTTPSTTAITPPAPVQPAVKPASIWPYIALASASLLGGGGIGAAVAKYLTPVAAVGTDTDTQYQLRLVEPKAKGQ